MDGQLVAYALNARVKRHLVDRRRVPTRPGKVEGDRRVARPFLAHTLDPDLVGDRRSLADLNPHELGG